MIESVMYFAIGFLVASLFAVAFIPVVHERAVRLTMRRLEAATPMSMAEIQADKDQLRAEFAMSTRRLEMNVDQLKSRTQGQLAEIGKKTEAINRLKIELGDKTATIFALEAREKSLKDQIRATEEEYAVKTAALREAERTLIDREADLSKLADELDDRATASDAQRIEAVALRSQIEALKDRVASYEREVGSTHERLERERSAVGVASRELNDERGRVENLGTRVGQLEHQLAGQTAEAEILGRRATELESRVHDQNRTLVERDHQIEQLRAALETAIVMEKDLRAEIAALDQQHRDAIAGLSQEKTILERQFEQSNTQREKLGEELSAMKNEAEDAWATERVENALLRERINDIAAEVGRLTSALEGPDSPLDAILAAPATVVPRNGAHENGHSASDPAQGGLADRMRALQVRASRIPSTQS